MKKTIFIMLEISFILLISCIYTTENVKEEKRIEKKIDKQLSLKLLCACIQTYNSYNDETPDIIAGYNNPEIFSGNIIGKTEKMGLIYQANDNSSIIIAFRGSKSMEDWIEDFEFWSTKDYQKYVNEKGLLVEHGFFQVYNAVRNTVFEKIKKMDKTGKAKLYITGHSLGSSAAVLFTLDMVYNNYYKSKNVVMYNYAGPRVGNNKFAEVYDKYIKNSIRFVNQNDLVPCLPPNIILDNEYKHVYGQYLICFEPADHDKMVANCHYSIHYYKTLEEIFKIRKECKHDKDKVKISICKPDLQYKNDYKILIEKFPEMKQSIKKLPDE